MRTSAQAKLAIYYANGLVEIIQGNNSKMAVRGSTLVKSDALRIGLGAVCMLIGANGKSLQLNSAGTYAYEKLEQLISKAGVTNVSQRYFQYVYDNLFNVVNADKLSISPVVFRDEVLMINPMNYSIITANIVFFSWKKPVDNNNVHIQIRNDNKVILDSIFKKSSSAAINLSKFSQHAAAYEWRAEEAGSKQHLEVWHQFLIPAKKDWKKVDSDLNLLQNKSLNKKLKKQMLMDMFGKWKNTEKGILY